MDDMQAFERRVADEMLRRAGPSLPFDNLAITDAVTATHSPNFEGSGSIPEQGRRDSPARRERMKHNT